MVLRWMNDGGCAVVGMVQLPALPGSSRWTGQSLASITDTALADADALADAGIDVLMVQNLGDLPVADTVSPFQLACMTRIIRDIRARFSKPIGLNFLENDTDAMLAAAVATQADFIRVKVFIGTVSTPFGMLGAKAHAAVKARNQIGAHHCAIFADVHDRTGIAVGSAGFAEDLDNSIGLGGADGIVLTGRTIEETLEFVRHARQRYPAVPILIGGGVTPDNFKVLTAQANGAIVSTAFKESGNATGQVSRPKAQEFMRAVRAA